MVECAFSVALQAPVPGMYKHENIAKDYILHAIICRYIIIRTRYGRLNKQKQVVVR